MRLLLTALLLTTWLAAGCGSGYDDPFDQPQRQSSPEALGVVVDPTAADPAAGQDNAQASPEGKRETKAPAAKREPRKEVSRQEAKVGVGERGRYEAGIITTPISAYFSVQERLAFERIPRLLDMYELTKGHYPKTHKEFMEGIIKQNALVLPSLPRGQRYVYEPKDRKLYVEHPK